MRLHQQQEIPSSDPQANSKGDVEKSCGERFAQVENGRNICPRFFNNLSVYSLDKNIEP